MPESARNLRMLTPGDFNAVYSTLRFYDASEPVIGANLRDAIREELDNFFDIKDVKFDIRVAQINQQVTEKKKRRVR